MLNAYDHLPPIIGHRGASGTTPENTLISIQDAANQGARWVEIDVALSADDVAVIFHDESVDRTTNGHGLLIKHSLADLKALDAGRWKAPSFRAASVPTLAEAIECIAHNNMGLNLEIKPCEGLENETVAATVAVLKQHWPEHLPLLFSSFNPYALKATLNMWPEVQRAYNVNVIPSNWRTRLEELQCSGLHLHYRFFDADIISAIKDAGYKTAAFTINNETLATQLLAEGLDAVFTDYPAKMIEAIRPSAVPILKTGIV